MLQIDGAGGGGQLVRSALTCSLSTGEGFELAGIRGDRPDPGLKPQHLAAVELAADLSDATVSGAELGSETLTFDPGPVSSGDYAVDIGTAGSVTLVCDVVLPLAARLDDPLTVTVEGGTDVQWSPPVDYLSRVKLPLVREVGWSASVDVARRGFYPVGGGRVALSLSPSAPDPLEYTGRGDQGGATVYAVESDHLSDADVADRLAETATGGLQAAGWSVDARTETVESDSPGAVVVVRLDYEGGVAGVSALGEKGVPAEDVADRAVAAAESFDSGPGAVDARLADQLVLPVALSGGRVWIPGVTDHVGTNVELVRAFGFDVWVEELDRGALLRA